MTTITRGGSTLPCATLRSALILIRDFPFIENFDGKAGFLGHGFGFFGEDARRELVRRFVDEVASEILGLGDDAAFRKTFVSRRALGVRVTGDDHRFDILVVFLVGLVFVGFEIGEERALGDDLGGFADGLAFTDKEDKILYGAR